MPEFLDDMVLIWDFQERLIEANSKAQTVLGYSPEELKDLRLTDIIPPVYAKYFAIYKGKLHRGKSVLIRAQCLTKAGVALPVRLRAFRFYYAGEELIFFLCRDISPQLKLKKLLRNNALQIKKQQSELMQAEQLVSELIRLIPKEIRRVKKKMRLATEQLVLPLLRKIKAQIIDEKQIHILDNAITQLALVFEKKANTAFMHLTQKEREICSSLCQNLTTKEIAARLALSVRTIETYRKKIRKKLGISSEKTNLITFLKTWL